MGVGSKTQRLTPGDDRTSLVRRCIRRGPKARPSYFLWDDCRAEGGVGCPSCSRTRLQTPWSCRIFLVNKEPSTIDDEQWRSTAKKAAITYEGAGDALLLIVEQLPAEMLNR